MSKRRPLPYHASFCIDNALSLIADVKRTLREMLAEPRNDRDTARLARCGWKFEEAQNFLHQIERERRE